MTGTRMLTALFGMAVAGLVASDVRGQGVIIPPTNNVGGVYIDTDGTVKVRTTETAGDLAAQRLRAKALNAGAKADGGLTYVSIPRVLEQAKALAAEGKELPDDLRYLAGLTSVRYVFMFPGEKDLVIAGPAEPIDATNTLNAFGKITGRPVLHLDDLVTALRMAAAADRVRGTVPFGCSIDPAPDSLDKSAAVMRDHARSSRGERMKAMKDALGPQKVSLFGAPDNSRLSFVTLAADYKLKRMCLALDPIPVPGVGSPIDNSRAAGNRFWFEASYAPLLMSPEGDAFEIRGPRLMLKAGALLFDDKGGGTETGKRFAANFTAKITQLATVTPIFADLQNVTDLALVAHLIRHDKLAQKAGVDLSYAVSGQGYKVGTLATPRSAETVVNFTAGSIVAGGVTLDLASLVGGIKRETDPKGDLKGVKVRPAGWSEAKGK